VATAMRIDHYPAGEPRRRLRSYALPCPMTGRLMVGEECLQSGCRYAEEAEGFLDCSFKGPVEAVCSRGPLAATSGHRRAGVG